jgi:hypothetical protein
MNNKIEPKWYQKPTTVIILLIFFFPVGLYLMWKNELWTKKTRWIATGVVAVMVIANSGNNNSVVSNSSNSSTQSKKRTNDCSGYGDKSFIESKMKQMDRDIVSFEEIGKRKYYIRYISWRTGNAVDGDQILDYKNAPCRD